MKTKISSPKVKTQTANIFHVRAMVCGFESHPLQKGRLTGKSHGIEKSLD